MVKLIIRNSNGDIEEQNVEKLANFSPTQGQHYYFTGVKEYTFTLTNNNTTMDVSLIDNDGNSLHVILKDMAELIQKNNPMDIFSLDTVFGVSLNAEGDKQIEEALANKEFSSGEIIKALKEALALGDDNAADGAVIDDFKSLMEALSATAAGEKVVDSSFVIAEDREQEVTPNRAREENIQNPENPVSSISPAATIKQTPTQTEVVSPTVTLTASPIEYTITLTESFIETTTITQTAVDTITVTLTNNETI